MGDSVRIKDIKDKLLHCFVGETTEDCVGATCLIMATLCVACKVSPQQMIDAIDDVYKSLQERFGDELA